MPSTGANPGPTRGLRRTLARKLDRNLAARRLARRLGLWTPAGPARPPESPVGVKLELTHRCNLKCGFCYTDSPRHTRAKTPDLSDDAWRAVVREVVELGVVEAVVTGGEPLLRRELALELIDTLTSAGVGVTLNTNGWFVDDEVADRLAEVDDLQVTVSLDGATGELHDRSRGLNGSWERAVRAIDRLLSRGVRIRVVHVVTPANEPFIDDLLEHAFLLGVTVVRVTRVSMFGAAARGGAWGVDSGSLHAAVERFQSRFGEEMAVAATTASMATLAALEDVSPAALLVRPSGAVLIDSVKPFRFGTVPDESLEECWRRIESTWPHPAIVDWAGAITTAAGIARSAHVPYLDDEVSLAPVPATNGRNGGVPARELAVPAAVPDRPEHVDLALARRHVVDLALARAYELGQVRWTGGGRRGRYVRVAADRRTCVLNETAAVVMDACADGVPAAAVETLARRYPSVARETLETDVLRSVRSLHCRNILRPAAAPVRAA